MLCGAVGDSRFRGRRTRHAQIAADATVEEWVAGLYECRKLVHANCRAVTDAISAGDVHDVLGRLTRLTTTLVSTRNIMNGALVCVRTVYGEHWERSHDRAGLRVALSALRGEMDLVASALQLARKQFQTTEIARLLQSYIDCFIAVGDLSKPLTACSLSPFALRMREDG